ncbi:phosphohydrolase [Deinococcus sp. HMF7620]|uniref:Phosphohydrolase n=1 Tax=Deinococcus arboris TaxID=2682977 RepID=A0A7C9HXY2_9DEIO|nr:MULTISPECIES: phosphohydrolase [Deinococcus]MBZ9751498.1 phosphohydrolase [Deinococcus betulae]MVN86588.1 phosphohydrolase [Deinococcus arboris]
MNVEGGKVSDVAGREGTPPARVVEFTTPRAKLIEEANQAIRTDLAEYPRALAAYEALRADPEALAHWDMANYITMRKLGYNDHGRVHAFITGAASMAITELLLEAGVKTDIMESGVGGAEDVFLAVILGTMLHDIGNQIHRVGHEGHGVALALPILDRIMGPLYPDPFKRTKVRSFILGAINCHDLNPAPLTLEGGITAVADGTDITKGRGRKAFSLGSVDIHSISALAVDQVVIEKGRDKPVLINVTMNNSGGIFQVEEILAPKVIRTPMRRFVELRATTREEGDEQILSKVRLDGDHFVMDLESGERVAVEVMDTQKQVQKAVVENLGIGNDSR